MWDKLFNGKLERKWSCLYISITKGANFIFLIMFIQVKSNAVRALGYLSRFIRFNHHSDAVDEPRLLNIL
jgi:hypothetical protein